ncbi:MAG: archaellin/type IV pilin N-terminal domain-containing protein [Thermoplasmatota archaeon]
MINDEAVSPVIAVILMVAITVVLAATVYVWVSGFGASGSQAKSLSVSELNCGLTTDKHWIYTNFTAVSSSSNFAYTALKVKDTTNPTAVGTVTGPASQTNILAGDTMALKFNLASTTFTACSDTIGFVDSGSGNVVSTATLH